MLRSTLESLFGRRPPRAAPARADASAGEGVAAARALAAAGRRREAARVAGTVLADVAGDPVATAEMAGLCIAAGDAGAGLAALDAARRRAPSSVDVARAWAVALQSMQRWSEASAAWAVLIATRPDDAGAWIAKAEAEAHANDPRAARASIARALELDPAATLAWRLRGGLDALDDRLDDAIDAFDRAERACTDGETDAFAVLAVARFRQGRWRECRDALEAELPRRPDLNGHMQLGPTLLAHGEFEEGWKQYEFRWMVGAFATERPAWERPHWDGQDLRGKRVLVVPEQGIGDFLQFARYFPLLQARGARVLLKPPDALAGIAARLPGIDTLIDPGSPVPAHDYFVFLLSLPRAFGTRADTIPPCTAPLAPREDRVAKWASKLGPRHKPRVGVVWAGRPEHSRDRQRSVPLASLLPLRDVAGVRFVGMQKGPAVAQAEIVPERVDWLSVGPESDDLEDAAAIVAGLDLVITVDTAIAHLGGVMGKTVWMLVADPPDFRWGLEGEATPWYPTLRLFRQPVPGDWVTPVTRMADALRAWAGDPASVAPPRAAARGPIVETRIPHLARALPTRHGFVQYDPDEPRVGRSIERYGEWLQDALDAALASTRPGATVVIASPGIGMHAIPLARGLGDDGHLMLFEPRAPIRRMLAHNLAANGIGNATLLPRALGAVPGTDADAIDGLALARVDGLKLESGSDADAIVEGASETLWRCRPWVAIACDDEPTLARRAARLRESGYRPFALRSPLHRRDNFAQRDEDAFGGQVALTLIALPEEADAPDGWSALGERLRAIA